MQKNSFFRTLIKNPVDKSNNFLIKHLFSSRNSDYFIPPSRILFRNGQSKIYNYTNYKGIRTGYMIMGGITGFITYKFVNKIYQWKESGMLGIIFFGGLTLFLTPKFRLIAKVFNQIISRIDLLQDGKTILVKHAKYGIIPAETRFDIALVAKPASPDEVAIIQFAFPILIDNQLFYLPRDNEDINKEVLPAVLNGKYIDIGNSEEEINI